MEFLIDPVVADLQMEHGKAVSGGRVWKGRWVRVLGYIAFAKVFAWAGLRGTRLAWHNWSREDHLALVRVLWLSVIGVPAVSLILYLNEIPTLLDLRRMNPQSSLTVLTSFLIPSTLALGLPLGLAMSIAATSGRALSRRVRAAVILIAVAASAGSLINVAWVTPWANQAYREEIMGRPVPRGQNELTLAELNREPGGAFMFHTRMVLAIAPLTFAVFGVVTATRRRFRRVAAMSVAGAGGVGYVLLLMVGEVMSRRGLVPPVFAAWSPQLLLFAVSSLLVIIDEQDPAHPNTRVS
jgi:hypothetical protein